MGFPPERGWAAPAPSGRSRKAGLHLWPQRSGGAGRNGRLAARLGPPRRARRPPARRGEGPTKTPPRARARRQQPPSAFGPTIVTRRAGTQYAVRCRPLPATVGIERGRGPDREGPCMRPESTLGLLARRRLCAQTFIDLLAPHRPCSTVLAPVRTARIRSGTVARHSRRCQRVYRPDHKILRQHDRETGCLYLPFRSRR